MKHSLLPWIQSQGSLLWWDILSSSLQSDCNLLWSAVILAQEKLLVILTACKIISYKESRTRSSAFLSADLQKYDLQVRGKQHPLHVLQTKLSPPLCRRLPPWTVVSGICHQDNTVWDNLYICQGKHMSKQCFFLVHIPKWSLRSRRSQLPKAPISSAETRQHPGCSGCFAKYPSMLHYPSVHHLKAQDILQWQKLGPLSSVT